MVFQFRIISDEVKDFARELVIGQDQTFLEFHHTLQTDRFDGYSRSVSPERTKEGVYFGKTV